DDIGDDEVVSEPPLDLDILTGQRAGARGGVGVLLHRADAGGLEVHLRADPGHECPGALVAVAITAAAIIPGEVDEAVAVVVDTIVALVYGGVSVGDPGVLDPQPGGAEGIANAGADAGGHAPLQADDAVFEGNLTRHEAKLDEPVVVGHHRAVGAHGLDVEGHGAGDLPTTG